MKNVFQLCILSFYSLTQVWSSLQGQENQHITTYISCSDGVKETDGGYIQMHIVDAGQINDIVLTLNPSYIVENSTPNQYIGKK